MPLDYQIDHSRWLVITTAEGVLSNDDLLNHQIRVRSDRRYDPTLSQLNDIRMADLTGLDADCVEILSRRAEPKSGIKVALIVGDEIGKQFARTFEGLRAGTGEKLRVFRDLDSAYGWLEPQPPHPPRVGRAQDHRAAVRVSAESDPRVPDRVNFIASEIEGTGRIANMSTSGVLISNPSCSLDIRAEADLYFLRPGTKQLLQARGRVVRNEGQSFAVQFSRIERDLELLINVAAESS